MVKSSEEADNPEATPPATLPTTQEGTGDAPDKVKAEAEKETTALADPTTPPATTTTPATTPPTPEVKKMRAIILSSYGGLKGVKLAERPQPPEPKEGQVTIQVKISGVNFQDLMMRLGMIDPQPKTPFILGTELIGNVTAVGENVTKLKVGDLVFALPECGGAWAELVNLEERLVWKVTQPQIPLEKLASTYSYLVAHLLLQIARVERGANVLIHSAGGAVGLAMKDLAKDKGINVIGIASSGKHEKLEGFAHLIARGHDYVDEVKKLHPEGFDAVFDSQGGVDCPRGISLLAPLGSYVLYGSANIVTGENRSFLAIAKSWWSQVEKQSPMKLFEENKSIGGLSVRHLIKHAPQKVEAALATVWDMMAKGTINPVQDQSFHFEQMAQAMQRMHERKNVGKVLILPEPAPPAAVEEGKEVGDGDKNGAATPPPAEKNGESSPKAPPSE